MGAESPLCYVWLGTLQKMANASKCKLYEFLNDIGLFIAI